MRQRVLKTVAAMVLALSAGSTVGAHTAAAGPSGSDGATFVTFTQLLRTCDFKSNLHADPSGVARTTALVHTTGSEVISDVVMVTAIPNTAYDVRVIQMPRSSATGCNPGDPGVTGGAPHHRRHRRRRPQHSQPHCLGRDRRVDVHHAAGRVHADTSGVLHLRFRRTDLERGSAVVDHRLLLDHRAADRNPELGGGDGVALDGYAFHVTQVRRRSAHRPDVPTRIPVRRATAATCAASSGSDLVAARARARRPLCALLK